MIFVRMKSGLCLHHFDAQNGFAGETKVTGLVGMKKYSNKKMYAMNQLPTTQFKNTGNIVERLSNCCFPNQFPFDHI